MIEEYKQHSILDEIGLEKTDYISVDYFVETLINEYHFTLKMVANSLKKVGKVTPEERNKCMQDILADIRICELRSIMNAADNGEFTIGYYNNIIK